MSTQASDRSVGIPRSRFDLVDSTLTEVGKVIVSRRGLPALVWALLLLGALVLGVTSFRLFGSASEAGFIAAFAMGILLVVLGALLALYSEWANLEMARRAMEITRLLLRECSEPRQPAKDSQSDPGLLPGGIARNLDK